MDSVALDSTATPSVRSIGVFLASIRLFAKAFDGSARRKAE